MSGSGRFAMNCIWHLIPKINIDGLSPVRLFAVKYVERMRRPSSSSLVVALVESQPLA